MEYNEASTKYYENKLEARGALDSFINDNKNRTQLTAMNNTDQFGTFGKTSMIESYREEGNKEDRRSVLDYLKSNKIFNAKFQTKNDNLSASAKKKALNKVIRLHQAFSNKRLGESENNSPNCKTTKISGRSAYRFASVKEDKAGVQNTRQNKLSLTNYRTGFRSKLDKPPSRSVMGTAYSSGDPNRMKLRTINNTSSFYNQKENHFGQIRSTKNKYGPEKVRPFLDYDFTQYRNPESELPTEEPPAPVAQEPAKGKVPPKGKEEPVQERTYFKMGKNILFEKIDNIDSDSDFEDTKFL